MNPLWEGLLEELYRQMEQEILHYHLLVEEMKKESEYLKKGSTNSLLESLRSIENHTTELQKIHESIQKSIEKILGPREGKEERRELSSLLFLLPPKDSQRIKDYLRTLGSLKKWITQINARNKAFIQESLAYWKDLFFLLAGVPAESPVYFQNGKTQSSTHPPISLSREV